MNKKILMTLAVAMMMATGTAKAETAQGGDFAFFLSNVFGNNSFLGGNPVTGMGGGEGSSLQPTYNIGYMVTDNLMPYGGFSQQNWGGGTATMLRGGARFYLADRGDVRLFADGELFIFMNSADNSDSIGLLGNAGVEYNFNRNFSIAGRVGLALTSNDDGVNGGNSQVTLGAADVVLGFYF